MKILFVSSSNSPTGISPLIKNQAESLKFDDIKTDLYGIAGKGFWGYFKNIIYLRKLIRNAPYDIIHAHYGSSGIIALLSRGKERIIVSFMGDDVLGTKDFNGKQVFAGRILSISNRILGLLFYDHIILKSSKMQDRFPVSRKVSVIPNGIDLNRFYIINKSDSRRYLEIEQEKNIVLFISDPSRPEKNFNLAKKSVICCRTEVTLLQIYNETQDRLVYYYNAADLLLLTSFHEGSPNVVKEAMACNCSVVSTNVGDIEYLFGNEEGYFITTYDEKDVANKIDLAIKFSKQSGRTRGRERIKVLNLDSDSIAGRLREIYIKVLNK